MLAWARQRRLLYILTQASRHLVNWGDWELRFWIGSILSKCFPSFRWECWHQVGLLFPCSVGYDQEPILQAWLKIHIKCFLVHLICLVFKIQHHFCVFVSKILVIPILLTTSLKLEKKILKVNLLSYLRYMHIMKNGYVQLYKQENNFQDDLAIYKPYLFMKL